MIDGQLSAAEPLGQPAGRDRGQGACVGELVAAWLATAYSTPGWTAPTNTRPPSVISTETRLVCSSRPLPQAPLTDLAEPSSAFKTAALSPEPPLPGADTLPPGAVSPADGRS